MYTTAISIFILFLSGTPAFHSSLFSPNKAIHCLSYDAFIRLHKWLGVPRLFAGGKPQAKKFIHQEGLARQVVGFMTIKTTINLCTGYMTYIKALYSDSFFLSCAIIFQITHDCYTSKNNHTQSLFPSKTFDIEKHIVLY